MRGGRKRLHGLCVSLTDAKRLDEVRGDEGGYGGGWRGAAGLVMINSLFFPLLFLTPGLLHFVFCLSF